ncbi:type II toxin-antitoxin system HicA family toxin [Candidatus Sumerlaeota bacterium]|nr:type II toxin-antitoxin system HicA family toxin [Candidatus Sumerlaeota bacterium]
MKSLLEKDGWAYRREGKHGPIYVKPINGMWHTTQIPRKWDSEAIAVGTLQAILSTRQTGLGKAGLLRLLESE